MIIVPISMTPEQRELLRMDAEKHEMTVSAYVRWLIRREREVQHEKSGC